MQVDPLQERRVNAIILSEAKNLGFRFELLAAAEERSGRGNGVWPYFHCTWWE